MDMTTNYLGLNLSNPLMAGASHLVDRLEMVKRLEEAGSSAIVMHSLFEEQIVSDQLAVSDAVDTPSESFAEAVSYFPSLEKFALDPEDYLEQIRKIKQAVSIPVIASLNGLTPGGWLKYAKLIQEAGADALELNIYFLAADVRENASFLEQKAVDMVFMIKQFVSIPLAVKLSPFYTSITSFTQRLVDSGADGLVLFNRFYQPDIDIDELELIRKLSLSTSDELLLRLQWLAILSPILKTSLAVTGGAHTAEDAIKSIMCGANAVQMVSAVLKHGPEHIKKVRDAMKSWMEEHQYTSVSEMRGSMNLAKCPDATVFERSNYVKILKSGFSG